MKCPTCKLSHAPSDSLVDLGWHTFTTGTAHLAVCQGAESHPGRLIMAVCGAVWSESRDVDRDEHGYLVAKRMCQTCRQRVEKLAAEAAS